MKEGNAVGLRASEYTADMASHPEGDWYVLHCTSCVAKNCPGLMNETGAPETRNIGSEEAKNLLEHTSNGRLEDVLGLAAVRLTEGIWLTSAET